MKDKIKNHIEPEEDFSDALKSVVQKIEVNASFKAELGKQLVEAYQPAKLDFGQSVFNRAIPAFGWLFALTLMALVLNWMFRSIAPPPIPAAQETLIPSTQNIISPTPNEFTTPAPEDGGYDWRGAKLYLAQPLPESPAEANVYQLRKDQQITPEETRALASRFGLQGEIYSSYDYVFSVNNYYFTDGKQALEVYSNRRFTYTADLAKASTTEIQFTQTEDAEANIREFLSARGFEFPFKITPIEYFGGYSLEPLAPDGLTIQYESFTFPPMLIKLDENGEVFSIDATLVDYDSTPLGTYGIISAQEALNNVMNDNEQGGKKEFFHSADSKLPQTFYRVYPDAQTVTVYGYVASNLPVDPSRSPFITIDGVPAIGNVSGLEQLERATLIEATGQYLIQDGIRHFDVDSWTTDVELAYISGTLRRDGDQIILIVSAAGTDWQAPLVGPGKEYPLIDPPIDLPLDIKPESQLTVTGVFVGEEIFWTNIQYFEIVGDGGGGGGGGLGFYQLNLSGTPLPFPSPTTQPETNQGNIEYIIKEGDTVHAIAEAYGITPEIIVQANSWLDSGALTPGKTLIIPGAELSSESGQYTVKEGDTLSTIAENHGITVNELMKANGLNDPTILVGQKLIVSSGQVSFGQEVAIPEEQLIQLEIGQHVENERGIFQVNIYEESQRIEYGFFATSLEKSDFPYLILEGNDLQSLQKYNNLPINIWGTVESFDQYGKPIVKIERYEIPFPDLDFQIIEGRQKMIEIEGKDILTFTTDDGTTYVQIGSSVYPLDANMLFGNEDDKLLMEVLIIPDEIYKGYPTLRMYSANLAVDPISGKDNELSVTVNQFNTYTEPPATTEVYIPPTVTIDKVELVYYASNPYYQVNDPNYSQRSPYIQPAWHFLGHYDDGTEFDILIQALKQEFLLPELAPGLSPG